MSGAAQFALWVYGITMGAASIAVVGIAIASALQERNRR
jgi:hypothetical protein